MDWCFVISGAGSISVTQHVAIGNPQTEAQSKEIGCLLTFALFVTDRVFSWHGMWKSGWPLVDLCHWWCRFEVPDSSNLRTELARCHSKLAKARHHACTYQNPYT